MTKLNTKFQLFMNVLSKWLSQIRILIIESSQELDIC